jgi:hypothetical protein
VFTTALIGVRAGDSTTQKVFMNICGHDAVEVPKNKFGQEASCQDCRSTSPMVLP